MFQDFDIGVRDVRHVLATTKLDCLTVDTDDLELRQMLYVSNVDGVERGCIFELALVERMLRVFGYWLNVVQTEIERGFLCYV